MRFEIDTLQTKGGNQEAKTYYLNEPQATLLLTFMRNNEIIIEFKVRLVKEFYRMRKEINNTETSYQHVQTQNETFDLDFYTQEIEKIFKLVKLINSQNIKDLYFADNLSKTLNIKSPFELLKIEIKNYYLIPTELGKFINASPVEINKILELKGLQLRENGVWHLTEKGRDFGIEFKNGSFIQIKWRLESII